MVSAGHTTHMFEYSTENTRLSMAAIREVFSGFADFECRGVLPGLDSGA